MAYWDIITSHLREDKRIQASVLAIRRVYRHEMYEVYVCVYSGLMGSKSMQDDLVTCMVVLRREETRIMLKLWTEEIRGDRNAYIEKAVERLRREGKHPLHLVRDAKLWAGLKLTLHDRAAMRMAGVETPRTVEGF